MTPKQRRKAADAATEKLRAQVLRDIKKRLSGLMHSYGITFVAFRLGIAPQAAEAMLAGETKLDFDRLSDLALAVGCRLEPKITPRRK
jgi:hypothetical protein